MCIVQSQQIYDISTSYRHVCCYLCDHAYAILSWQVSDYGTCGGRSSTPAASDAEDPGLCCAPDSTCQRQNEWYWQCLPNPFTAGRLGPGGCLQVIMPRTRCSIHCDPRRSYRRSPPRVHAGRLKTNSNMWPCTVAHVSGQAIISRCSCILFNTSLRMLFLPLVTSHHACVQHADTHNVHTHAQVNIWELCGGLNSRAQANAADPSLCCPSGSTCNSMNDWYWQCQPGGPAGASPSPPAATREWGKHRHAVQGCCTLRSPRFVQGCIWHQRQHQQVQAEPVHDQ
jgi:hypothetical protein